MGGARITACAVAVCFLIAAAAATAQPTPPDQPADPPQDTPEKPKPKLVHADDHKGDKADEADEADRADKADTKVRHSKHSRPGGRPHFVKGELTRLTAARPDIPDRFVGRTCRASQSTR